nr:hypothetical protein BHI3_12270 [Bacteriovorax sp. HI3]
MRKMIFLAAFIWSFGAFANCTPGIEKQFSVGEKAELVLKSSYYEVTILEIPSESTVKVGFSDGSYSVYQVSQMRKILSSLKGFQSNDKVELIENGFHNDAVILYLLSDETAKLRLANGSIRVAPIFLLSHLLPSL